MVMMMIVVMMVVVVVMMVVAVMVMAVIMVVVLMAVVMSMMVVVVVVMVMMIRGRFLLFFSVYCHCHVCAGDSTGYPFLCFHMHTGQAQSIHSIQESLLVFQKII